MRYVTRLLSAKSNRACHQVHDDKNTLCASATQPLRFATYTVPGLVSWARRHPLCGGLADGHVYIRTPFLYDGFFIPCILSKIRRADADILVKLCGNMLCAEKLQIYFEKPVQKHNISTRFDSNESTKTFSMPSETSEALCISVESGCTDDGKTTDTADGKTTDISDGKTTDISDGKTTDIADGKTTDIADGKITDIADGKTTDIADGKTTDIADGKTTDIADGKTTDTADGKTTDTADGKTTGQKKRVNDTEDDAAHKKAKKTKIAWLIPVDCASKKDIQVFDLDMSDPFKQITKSYFDANTSIQQVLVTNNNKVVKKKNVAFCFDEESMYTLKQNAVMTSICREIWQDAGYNPFQYGAFGHYILYYSGCVSGAPCVDMEPVDTIDALIERLRACT